MPSEIMLSDLSKADLSRLNPQQREVLGIPAVPRNVMQRFIEGNDFLSKRGFLRALFNLDRDMRAEPAPFDLDDLYHGRTLSWYEQQMSFENSRLASYRLCQEMAQFGMIAAVLSSYAEDATQYDYEHGRTVWIESDNQEDKKILTEMLDRCQIEDRVYSYAYTTALFGDNFENIIYSRDDGVLSLRFIHPGFMTRIEDERGNLVGFVPELIEEDDLRKIPFDDLKKKFEGRFAEPWDFVHFRLQGGRRTGAHGMSLILDARRSWRQVKMMEDAMVLYRLNRAPTRLLFKIDTGTQNIEEQKRTLNTWRQFFRKRLYLNTATGVFRQEVNPMGVDEDLFLGVSKDKATDITKLEGSSNVGDIHDVEYMISKLAGDLKVPKAFFGFEGDLNSRASLVAQDVRYARGVKRLQRAIIYGLTQLCRIHLAMIGRDPLDEKHAFAVRMSPISQLDEMQRAEVFGSRTELTQNMLNLATDDFDKPEWSRFVLRDIMKLTDAQVAKIVPFRMEEELPPAQAGAPGMPGMPMDVGMPGPGDADLSMEPDGASVPRDVALDREPAGGAAGGGAAAGAEQELPGEEVGAEPSDAEASLTAGRKASGRVLAERVVISKKEGKLPQRETLREELLDFDAELNDYQKTVRQQRVQELLSSCGSCGSKHVKVFIKEDKQRFLVCGVCPFIAQLEENTEVKIGPS